MIYTKALKWSGGFIFYPIDLKIDMHTNGGIGNLLLTLFDWAPGEDVDRYRLECPVLISTWSTWLKLIILWSLNVF